ncbi:hypothetical protein J2S17_004363 [Cytobacillus purgationiresistens]|uniref:Uncharacterized protein n=2 Tax=Cytobacillus purgationiresistens TaxID=863449 RepID=A0ABU0AMI6_9BACI|nr:hypothetical protein [Cytobacillus purgationiresistens]
MALSLYDLLENKDIVQKARAEFIKQTEGKLYECGILEDLLPPNATPVSQLVNM